MTDQIKSGSLSRLHVYEKCPFQAKLKFVNKIPEPTRPGESPLERGSRIHDAIEKYIRGEVEEIDKEVESHHDVIEAFKAAYELDPSKVEIEDSWHFDEDWNVVPEDDWANTKLIMKLDVFEWIADDEAIAVDWKTGRKHGNEVKHADQLHLYQLGAFMRYPQLERVHTRLYYTDQNESTSNTFTREEGLRFLKIFNNRLEKMLGDTLLLPNPSLHSCRFCPY